MLYYVYTEGELSREYHKGEIRWGISKEERRKLIARLAYETSLTNALVLEHDRFSDVVTRYFRTDSSIDSLLTDMRTCGFLVLDAHDSLRFAHKSFLEYYVAQFLLHECSSTAKSREALGRTVLPDEILYFLGDLVKSFQPALLETLNNLCSAVSATVRCNALNLLMYAGHARTSLSRQDLEQILFVKQKMPLLSFHDCRIQSIRITRSTVENLEIKKSLIESMAVHGGAINKLAIGNGTVCNRLDISATSVGLRVSGADLTSLELTNSTLKKASIENSTLVIGPCHEATFSEARLHNVLLRAPEMNQRKLAIDKCLFEGCILFEIDCRSDFLLNNVFRNCVFIRCYLDNSIAVSSLGGSSGFFVKKTASKGEPKAIEKSGQPFYWSPQRADREVQNFFDIKARTPALKRKKQEEFIRRSGWNDLVAIAFSQYKGALSAALDIRKIQETLLRINENPTSLIKEPEFNSTDSNYA